MDNIKVSIIIPVYNAKKYIKDTVKNVLNQKHSNIEIILVDDGSTDGSSEICDKLNNNKIICVHQENKGVSKTRNVGLSIATGDYILFLDSDDYIDENMIVNLVEAATKKNIDVVICGFSYVDNTKITEVVSNCDERVYEDHEVDLLILQLLENGVLSNIGTKLYKRSILNKYDIRFDERYSIYEDATFCLKVLRNSKKVYFVNKSFYYYRVDAGNSLVKRYKCNYFEAVKSYLQTLYSILCENNSKELNKVFFEKQIIYLRIAVLKNEVCKEYVCFRKRCMELYEDKFLGVCKRKNNQLSNNQKLILKLFDLKMFIIVYLILSVKSKR